MTARNFSSNVAEKTLTATMASNATTLSISSTSGLPSVPFTLVIEPDTANEEIVTVTNVNSLTLTVTRGTTGGDGTTAIEHASASKVRHMVSARDLQEPQNHIEASGAYSIKNPGDDSGVTTSTITKSLHGIASGEGSVVGTAKTQTLTNKTLTSPTITNPTISGTITGAVVTSANIVDGTIVAGDLADGAVTSAKILDGTIATGDIADSAITSAKIADGTIVNADINASAAIVATKLTGTTSQFNTALSDGDFATLAGSETLTNKKLTNPFFYQASPFTSATATLTLTAENIDTRILRYTGTNTADHTWTMPSQSSLDSYYTTAAIGDSFDFFVINNNPSGTAGILTISAGANTTRYGYGGVFADDTGAHFRLHKTGTTAWNLYRLA